MHSSQFTLRYKLAGCAAFLAALLITPQALLAQTANTAYGLNALAPNSGSYNSAFGFYSLFYNVSGYENTAIGAQTLFSNGNGYFNTAVGVNALYANNDGHNNTAMGVNALLSNNSGTYNTATGVNALYSNTTGYFNTAFGESALLANATGFGNTAVGYLALDKNDIGSENTAIGRNALYSITSGINNIAIGDTAGFSITGDNNIEIGNSGNSADNGVVRIGAVGTQQKAFIAGISGVLSSGGVQVYINSSGQLGTIRSSERFKKEIKSIDGISEKLLQLRPVSFIYKEDKTNELQYGLIAEEVAKVYPELVQYDEEGKPFTVYYHLLTPLLLSELQKEHALNRSQQTMLVAQQEKIVDVQTIVAQQHLKIEDQENQLNAQHAEMLAMMQQQKRQLSEMAVLQQKLVQLDIMFQANNQKGLSSEKVALVSSHEP